MTDRMQDSYINPNVEEDFFDKNQSYEGYHLSAVQIRQLSGTLNLTALSALVYLVFLALKLDQILPFNFKWIYVSVPLILSLCFLSWYLMIFLSTDFWKILNPGKAFLKATAIVASVSLNVFLVLLSLKGDGILDITYGAVFIPLFILIVLSLGGFIFIFPGLVDRESRFFRETIICAADLLLFSLFVITLCLKLDAKIQWDFLEVFSFVFAICFVHMVLLIYRLVEQGWKKIPYSALILLAGFLLAFMLVLKTEDIMKASWFIVLSPVFFMVLLLECKAASMMISTGNLKSQ